MKKRLDWSEKTLEVYQRIMKEKKPYTIKVLGKNLIVLPNVFSPKYFNDSVYFAEEIPKIVKNGSKFLEIGSGTGIVALFCALKGAFVTAVDINKDAIKNTKINSKLNNVKIDARLSNVFSSIKKSEKFDYIFWNHPFNYSTKKVKGALLKAGFDYKYKYLFEFIKKGKFFLNKNGKLLLGTGSFSELKLIRDYALECGYKVVLLKNKKMFLDNTRNNYMSFLIYELTPVTTKN